MCIIETCDHENGLAVKVSGTLSLATDHQRIDQDIPASERLALQISSTARVYLKVALLVAVFYFLRMKDGAHRNGLALANLYWK